MLFLKLQGKQTPFLTFVVGSVFLCGALTLSVRFAVIPLIKLLQVQYHEPLNTHSNGRKR